MHALMHFEFLYQQISIFTQRNLSFEYVCNIHLCVSALQSTPSHTTILGIHCYIRSSKWNSLPLKLNLNSNLLSYHFIVIATWKLIPYIQNRWSSNSSVDMWKCGQFISINTLNFYFTAGLVKRREASLKNRENFWQINIQW